MSSIQLSGVSKDEEKLIDIVAEGKGNSNFAAIRKDGEIREALNRACFYLLSDREHNKGWKGINTFADKALFDHDYCGLGHEYVDFLVNRSSYRHAYLTKDPEFIFNKCCFFSVDYPAQYVIAAAVALRMYREYNLTIDLWDEFRKYMDENLAFFMINFLYKSGKDGYTIGGYDGHKVVAGQPSTHQLWNFVDCNMENFDNYSSFSEELSYMNMFSVWSHEKGPSVNLSTKLIENETNKDSWGYVYTNKIMKIKNIEEHAKEFLNNNRRPDA